MHPIADAFAADTDLRRATDRLRAEYDEMPCLNLTAPQSARLLWIDEPVARAALEILRHDGYLARTREGRYVKKN